MSCLEQQGRVPEGKGEGLLIAQVTSGALTPSHFSGADSAVTIALDLNGTESPEELLEMICRKVGISRDDVVLTWASPPCETFSRANWSNLSRGNNHRKKEHGCPPADEEKGEKARQHEGKAA